MEKLNSLVSEWHTFSIKGAEKYRHILIKQILKPFIKQYYTDVKAVSDFYLEFDIEDKRKVIFSIRIMNERYFEPFERYFARAISDTSFKNLTGNYAFQILQGDFPFTQTDIPIEFVDCGIFGKISSAIIQKLGDSSITKGKILNFSLYLQLCWIKQKHFKNLDDIQFILLRGYQIRNPTKQFTQQVESIFQINEELITNIHNCIFLNNSKLKRPKWIQEWLDDCCNIVAQDNIRFKDESHIIELSSYYIPAIINRQLGISGMLKQLQMSFIARILESGN